MKKLIFQVPTCQAAAFMLILQVALPSAKQALDGAKQGFEQRKQGLYGSGWHSGFIRL